MLVGRVDAGGEDEWLKRFQLNGHYKYLLIFIASKSRNLISKFANENNKLLATTTEIT